MLTAPPRTVAVPTTRRPVATRTVAAVVAVAILVVAVLLSLAVGTATLPVSAVVSALLHGGQDDAAVIVRQVRLPRTVLGLLVGAALATSGALMQGLTRNPIADTGLLGINAGASLALVVAVDVAGTDAAGATWLTFAGAALGTLIVLALARRRRGSLVSLVLGGAVVAALLGSLTNVILVLSTRPANEFLLYQAGSLSGTETATVWRIVPFAVAGLLLGMTQGGSLNAIGLGEEVAASLGVRLGRVQLVVAVAVVLMAGSAVAGAGPIAFLGLATPHLVRPASGADQRWLLPLSAVTGAALLLLADVLGRVVFRPMELNVGVTTAVLGAPLLVFVVLRTRRSTR